MVRLFAASRPDPPARSAPFHGDRSVPVGGTWDGAASGGGVRQRTGAELWQHAIAVSIAPGGQQRTLAHQPRARGQPRARVLEADPNPEPSGMSRDICRECQHRSETGSPFRVRLAGASQARAAGHLPVWCWRATATFPYPEQSKRVGMEDLLVLELVILAGLFFYIWLRPERDRTWEQRWMRRRRRRRRHRQLQGVGLASRVRSEAGNASRARRA